MKTWMRVFKNRYFKKGANGSRYFDFNGAKLPDITNDAAKMETFVASVFEDIFLISLFYNDDYDKHIVDALDPYMDEGPYCYKDGAFDLTIKEGDIIFDAGAWIGDFSAYAASKGAIVYAFEPLKGTCKVLQTTAELNGPGKIYPVQKGLGDNECVADISFDEASGYGSTVEELTGFSKETIDITTVDQFVVKNNIQKINLIKADIEGAERKMLAGARNTLKNLAPNLAICTYHLPDDPYILEKIIMEANPRYKIVHLHKKLLASVKEK